MKIKNLTASVHQFPVYLPMIDKPLEHRVFTFCEIETDDGYKGCGVTGAFLPWSIVMALKHDILPVIKDMDPRDTEAIHEKIWWTLNPRAYTGVISNALSALDIALWDIKGKETGRSIAQLLGGYRDWAGTYITFGYPFFDRDQLVDEHQVPLFEALVARQFGQAHVARTGDVLSDERSLVAQVHQGIGLVFSQARHHLLHGDPGYAIGHARGNEYRTDKAQ